MKAASRFKVSRIAEYFTVYAFTVVVLLPLLYVLISSFKTGAEFNRVLALPSSLNFINFSRALSSPLVTSGFINSLIITIGAIVLAVGISALAGYVIARRTEKIFFFIYLFFLSSLMIPVSANLVSIYALMKSLGLTNNRGGLILIEAAGAIPVGILIYVGFVRTIPRELDEAAIVDGCGLFGRFWWIILPLLKPALISHAVLSSLGIWNDFLIPLLYPLKNPGDLKSSRKWLGYSVIVKRGKLFGIGRMRQENNLAQPVPTLCQDWPKFKPAAFCSIRLAKLGNLF